MRDLNRNKQTLWYALYKGREEIVDSNGFGTGQYKLAYSNPIKTRLNISAARGETTTRQFGEEEYYDKVLVSAVTEFPINEYSVLWIDSVPKLDRDGKLVLDERGDAVTPHDYTVERVARSLNGVSYAVRKVTVRG